MQSHIGCISLALLRCAFSDASSNCLHERTHSHTDCICLSFLHCVFSNFFSNCLHEMMHTHTDCKYLTSLHCVLSYVSSNCLSKKMQSCIGCTYVTFCNCLSLSLKSFHQVWFHCNHVVQGFDSSSQTTSVVYCVILVSNWQQIKMTNPCFEIFQPNEDPPFTYIVRKLWISAF